MFAGTSFPQRCAGRVSKPSGHAYGRMVLSTVTARRTLAHGHVACQGSKRSVARQPDVPPTQEREPPCRDGSLAPEEETRDRGERHRPLDEGRPGYPRRRAAKLRATACSLHGTPVLGPSGLAALHPRPGGPAIGSWRAPVCRLTLRHASASDGGIARRCDPVPGWSVPPVHTAASGERVPWLMDDGGAQS